ncbi:MAG: S41 family peptidase [bacterium]|nr:S41 family peptidase [bacterium]
MRFTLPQIRLIVIVLAIAVTSFFTGLWLGGRDVQVGIVGSTPQIKIDRKTPENQNVDFSLFWNVWDRLDANYFDKTKLDKKEMIYGSIQGMVSAIGDPYTVFLPPDDQKRSKEDLGGNFEGVGIQIGFRGSQLAVISPVEGSPASRANIKAGDFIIGIKDKTRNIEKGTTGLSIQEAVGAIRGPAGTEVILVLTREGEEKPFETGIVREKINVPSVILSFEGDIAHLKLMKFGEQTGSEWDASILKIKSQNPKGMILDVRNNPGGLLSGAVAISSEFLKAGSVAVGQEDGRGNKKELRVNGKPRLLEIPLVVLVNKGSASASEIVAGALKDNNRAKIVGDKTFGKGTVQESIDIESAGLHITTARWLTPNGNWVNSTEGLAPDIEIKDDSETEVDEQLDKAIELLR